MKNYDPNITFGIHTVKITLQMWGYTGHIFQEIAGNCRGKDVLDFDFEELNNDESFQYKNDCQMKCEEGEFSCVLKDEKGDALQVTDYAEEMNKLIVGMEIIDCSPESR